MTWAGIKSQIQYRIGTDASGREALGSEIRFFGSDDEELGRCSVAELLSAELSVTGTTYLLVDGEVCRVDTSFLASLDDYLERHRIANRLVPYGPGELEADYNSRAAAATNMLLLDKTEIRPGGESQIEPCDLLGLDGTLCHVKRHSTAAGISHLVSQAIASATVLLRESGAREKLCALVEPASWRSEEKLVLREKVEGLSSSASRLPVVLAVVGEWERPTVKSLSLLSRLALRSGVQRLEDIGFSTELMLIDAQRHSESSAIA